MRAFIRRVKAAWVYLDDRRVGSIGPGDLVLLGVGQADNQEKCRTGGHRRLPGAHAGGTTDGPATLLLKMC